VWATHRDGGRAALVIAGRCSGWYGSSVRLALLRDDVRRLDRERLCANYLN
jgi:hypothetical protein